MSGKPVLLVEDSDDDALLLKRTLNKVGLANPVYHVNDVDQALCYLSGEGPFADRNQHPLPSVIFLDLRLPVRGGYELLEWIGTRPEFRTIFIVVLAGTGNIEDIAKANRMGANTFLTKPCKPVTWKIS